MTKYYDAIIVDMETMDVLPTSVVLSLGVVAIKFGEESTPDQLASQGREWLFKTKRQVSMGRTVSGDTYRWWQSQGKEARHIFGVNSSEKHDVTEMANLLAEFAEEFPLHKYGTVWCRGPNFDFPIIENVVKSTGEDMPWPYWKIRDIRTKIDSFTGKTNGKVWKFEELMNEHYSLVKHNAMHDCINDAVLMDALETHFHDTLFDKTAMGIVDDPREFMTIRGREQLVNDAIERHMLKIGEKE